jgi:hypothetical protein
MARTGHHGRGPTNPPDNACLLFVMMPPARPADTLVVHATPSILFWLILGSLGYALATSVFSILAARLHFETQRHDLLVRSKQLRLEYLDTLDEKIAGVLDEDATGVIIEEEDEPQAKAA